MKNKINNKRGLSTVVITVIMIALVMVVTTIVWAVVNNLIKEEISSSESCFGILNKVTIGRQYSCYDAANDIVQFSINVGDIDVDEVLVSVSGNAGTKNPRISNDGLVFNGLTYFDGTTEPDGSVKLPRKNSGKTYKLSWGLVLEPDMIQVAPVVKGKQCESSDSLQNIESCSLLS